ncbi:pH-response regulator protein palA/rim20, partial [Tulasnella sp. 408]
MSNQLIIPFKTSRPVDIKSSVKLYIERQHPETHPDAFRADVEQWEALRKDAISGGVHA